MTATARLLTGDEARTYLAGACTVLYQQDPHATPYQSPTWLTGWASRLPPTSRLLVLAVEDRQLRRPMAALALARHEHGAGTEIRPLGAPHAEYVRPVGPHADAPETVTALGKTLSDLARSGSVLLTDVPATSGLAHVGAVRDWRQTGGRQCAAVPLPIPYGEMSRDTRRAHERRQRAWDQLARDTAVTYRRTRSTPELLAAWDVLAALHRRRHGPDSAVGLPPAMRDVLEQVGSAGAFIATLSVRDKAVAAQLCLYRGQTAYSLATGMDPEDPWRALAPGHGLIRYLGADLSTSGYTTLDLGRTRNSAGQLTYKGQYRPRWSSTVTISHTGLSRSAARRIMPDEDQLVLFMEEGAA